MGQTHKDSYRLSLFSLLVAHGLLLYALSAQRPIDAASLWAIAKSGPVIPVGIALALIGIINSLFSSRAKERLVFLEWENPLPGCRAFTPETLADHRINVASLLARVGPFPLEPLDQNRAWYGLYVQHRADAAVAGISRDYLFARDYAALAFLMLFFFGAVCLFAVSSGLRGLSFVALVALEYALAARAARDRARRLVTTVLAIHSA